ncbi:hypothetical protein [Fibrobacter succinogenes]|nr:hypothetical protein [Fibrobacter succinogenes]
MTRPFPSASSGQACYAPQGDGDAFDKPDHRYAPLGDDDAF